MLEKNYQYYIEHESELIKKYNGRYLAIKDCSIVGDYASELLAYNASIKKYELGTFLIQYCTSNKEQNNQLFHSRVIFA
jgi:hypothetical protein